MLRIGLSALACLAALLACSAVSRAQELSADHWAYGAVQDLSSKGLIKGYPPDGDFFGKRTVTRYEMATIVQRVLAYIEDRLAGKADRGTSGVPATGSPASGVVDPKALDEVRRLVNEFKIELGVIGADLQKVKDQIGEFRQELAAVKETADKAAADAAAAREVAEKAANELPDIIETLTLGRSEFEGLAKAVKAHAISGYLQARYEMFDSGQSSLFPAVGSTGGPAVGGPNYGFLVRRARIKVGGPLGTRSNYALQLDVPSTGATAVKDAYINVADLPLPDRMVLSAGLFVPPFGYEFPTSSGVRESPERAAGFSDSSASFSMHKGVKGMFDGQDRDVGAMLSWSAPNYQNPKTTVYAGVFNGEGRGSGGVRNTNKQLDTVLRVQTELLRGNADVGISGYYGAIGVKAQSSDTAPTRNAYRFLGGVDFRYFSPWGTTLRAEYMGGLYEVTPDRSLYLPGNHAHAWVVALKHPINPRFELALKYDEFYPVSQKDVTVGGLGRMDLVRKTIGGGLLYQLDEATRFRLWYSKGLTPYDPKASAGPNRSRLGLITSEIQITY
ncbi:MAG: hypothetical protein GX446_16405 [Chthonomonadales bacterium]|nr:hypothetical protein [Chthonomonadales bacterium]